MKRKRRLNISGGTVTLSAYCLKTDSWNDYLGFMQDAETATASGRVRDANRYLRAALVALFSHVEGVVNDIYAQRSIQGKNHSLCEKARAVAVAASRNAPVPFVNMRMEKYLRDLVAHPGITKAFADPRSKKTHLDEDDVFERLTIDTLRRLERHVSPWLDAVCNALNVKRLTDTKAEIEKFAPILNALGKMGDIKEV